MLSSFTKNIGTRLATVPLALALSQTLSFADEPLQISGIYPQLAMFNDQQECGTGAVVPWGDRLWAITYAPHKPNGSTDKLYEITPDLRQIVREESIGGTCANRMIHRESNQLFIGPYVIDQQRNVRAIPFSTMFGRHTGTTRHLMHPESKVYTMTMEEGLYEIDVNTLQVNTLYHDEAVPDKEPKANLPGYHGKGLYTSQGRLIYANNGERGNEARTNPRTSSGALTEWKEGEWSMVLRNQFTEVTGPGGIYGNADDNQPVWTIGWDYKSLLLMCLSEGEWHRWRLPKASHSYDGAHGWNTEWPRIREIGESDLLMTMHGMFWRFPAQFNPKQSGGIAPRSRYLKVVGDFCRWNDRIVLGCDDTANSEFLNKRKAKGTIAAPQSQSNLWFLQPEQLDSFGPANASGGVWLNESVEANVASDPFLLNGFQRSVLFIQHDSESPIEASIEVDLLGNGEWTLLKKVVAQPGRWNHWNLNAEQRANWVRLQVSSNVPSISAWFHLSDQDLRTDSREAKFAGIATERSQEIVGGTVRARGGNKRTLHFHAMSIAGESMESIGLYSLDGNLQLTRSDDAEALAFEKENAAIPEGAIEFDDASVLYIDDQGKRWRIPYGGQRSLTKQAPYRVCREVATERDLFNAAGIFYELPAENAGGFSKVSPVATHNLRITDYCSYRGLFVVSGIDLGSSATSKHLIRSDDGKAALWVGAADDLWSLGKPRGSGGPWMKTSVQRNVPSDPYLMAGFEYKELTLFHNSSKPVEFTIEIDPTGDGDWGTYTIQPVAAGETFRYQFPPGVTPRWMRVVANASCEATCQLSY